jgi:toxin ParE1/3/4
MPGFRFSARAEHDLEGIVDFTLRRWGTSQASKYVDRLEELAGTLAHNPALGKPRDELHKGLQSFPYESHVLFYHKERSGIAIVRILHENMDAPRHI